MQNLVMGIVVIVGSSLTIGCHSTATGRPSQQHVLLMFTDEGQGKIGMNAKIMEAKTGTSINATDYSSSDAALRAKGAKVIQRPYVSTISGVPCSFFIGQARVAGSLLPAEGTQLDLLSTMVEKEIRYTGSVITWTRASKSRDREGKVSRIEGSVGRTNTFAGECRIGEPVLVKGPDSQ